VVDAWEFVSIRSALAYEGREGLSASLLQEEEAGNFAPFHSHSELHSIHNVITTNHLTYDHRQQRTRDPVRSPNISCRSAD
jgi:hypothetical protein